MDIPLLGVIPYDKILIKADMDAKSPLDMGGAAVEHINELNTKILRLFI